ncbi:MAG: hypothetical protein EXX96DRAFT_613099 [Benjaminiella poitrasii]|nr:MAG: hypothetical protein EXX96DRAFT_613099 [Benjaminiella poitrasii]
MEKLILRRVQPLLRKDKTNVTHQAEDLAIDKKTFQRDPVETERLYKSLIIETYPSLPVPIEKCVPIMASSEQAYLYETQFVVPALNYPKYQTISDLLSVFSYSNIAPVGKLEFLLKFFTNIRSMNINLDVAVVCANARSQHFLYQSLLSKEFNIQIVSLIAPETGIYGVIVKIRKVGKRNTPITRMEVDIVMVYDSAIRYPEEQLNQFKGAYHHNPHVLYLTTMDTADIRCYISDIHDNNSWNDCYSKVKNQQQVFHQPNRHATPDQFKIWNQYIANQVAEWAKKKSTVPFHYFHPDKQASVVRGIWVSFPQHHKPLLKELHSALINNNNNNKTPPITVKAAFPALKENTAKSMGGGGGDGRHKSIIIANTTNKSRRDPSIVNSRSSSPASPITAPVATLPTPAEKNVNHDISTTALVGNNSSQLENISVLPPATPSEVTASSQVASSSSADVVPSLLQKRPLEEGNADSITSTTTSLQQQDDASSHKRLRLENQAPTQSCDNIPAVETAATVEKDKSTSADASDSFSSFFDDLLEQFENDMNNINVKF